LTASNDEAGWEAEKKFKARLSEAGVQMSSGALYREERPGWFRFVFTLDKDSLEEGLRR
jgi:xeroderma pigmentosum group C-complementing protein